MTSPIIVHHMAALDGWPHPPNTREGVQACLDANAAFIEIDVTALAHGDYLLVHDPVLDNETTSEGRVALTTPTQAAHLRVKMGDQATDYAVPLLSQIVQTMLAHGGQTRLQIDFKNMFPFPDDEPLTRFVRLIEPLGSRVLVSTGADWQLRKLRRLAPHLDLGFDPGFYLDWSESPYDPHQYPRKYSAYGYWDDHPVSYERVWPTADYLRDRCEALIGLVSALKVSTFYVNYRLLTTALADGFDFAARLHAEGIKLDAWTVDVGKPIAEAALPTLLAMGVDLLTTNTPHAVASRITS